MVLTQRFNAAEEERIVLMKEVSEYSSKCKELSSCIAKNEQKIVALQDELQTAALKATVFCKLIQELDNLLEITRSEAEVYRERLDSAVMTFNQQKGEMIASHKENLQKLQAQLMDRYNKQELPHLDATSSIESTSPSSNTVRFLMVIVAGSY